MTPEQQLDWDAVPSGSVDPRVYPAAREAGCRILVDTGHWNYPYAECAKAVSRGTVLAVGTPGYLRSHMAWLRVPVLEVLETTNLPMRRNPV